MLGVLSGSLPIGYCAQCLPSFKEGLAHSKNSPEYVYAQQLQGRYDHCNKCGEKARLYYPVKLRG